MNHKIQDHIPVLAVLFFLLLLCCGCNHAPQPKPPAESTVPGGASATPRVVSRSVDLFANVEFNECSDVHILDVAENAVLVSVSNRLPGHPEQFFGVGSVSDVYLLSSEGREIQKKWELSEENLECSNGVITEDGAVLFCCEADETFSDTDCKYQLRYYKNGEPKEILLGSGTCAGTGKTVLLNNNTLLYTLYENKNEVPTLRFCVILLDGTPVYTDEKEVRSTDIYDDRLSAENDGYLYSVLYYGGEKNAFFAGSGSEKPVLLRFNETNVDPIECVSIGNKFLTLTNEQNTANGGVLSRLRLYSQNGDLLSEAVYGDETVTNGFDSLYACGGLCITRTFDPLDPAGKIIPIVIENDTPRILDPMGNGAYKSFFAKGDRIYVYGASQAAGVACEIYERVAE